MDKQEIRRKIINSFKGISANNLPMSRIAESKNINYKNLNHHVSGVRCPMYGNYCKFYISLTTDKSWDEAEEYKRKAVRDFCDAFNEEFDKGYTYLQIEANTGISHSSLFKYRKYKVNDVSLYNVITLIEYMHLNIIVPGI